MVVGGRGAASPGSWIVPAVTLLSIATVTWLSRNDVIAEVAQVGPDRRADQRAGPWAPRATKLIEEPVGVEGIRCESRRRGALRDGPKRRRSWHAAAHGVRLIVENEQVRGGPGCCPSGRFEHLDRLHVEEPAEYFVHGQ